MWSEHTFQVLSLYGVGDRAAGRADDLRERGRRVDHAARRAAGRGRTLSAIQGHNENERARAEHDPDVLITTFDNLPTRTTPIKYPHPRTGRPCCTSRSR